MDDKKKLLYDAVSKDYDVGTFDEFNAKLQDSEKRKSFYDGVGKEYELGTYDEFNTKLDGALKKKDETISPTSKVGGQDTQTQKLGSEVQSTSSIVTKKVDLDNANIVQNKLRDLLKNNDSPAVKDAITKTLVKKGYDPNQITQFSDNISNAKKALEVLTPALNNQQQAQPYEDENPATAEVRMEQVPKVIPEKPILSYAAPQVKAQSEKDAKDIAKANEQAQKNTIPQNAYLAGRAYTTLGEPNKAIEMYNTALGNLSKDIETNGRKVYTESGVNTPNSTDAMVQETAVKAGHNPANIFNGLGHAWAQKGDDEKALDYYTQSLKYMGYTPPASKEGQPDKNIASEQQGEESPESIALKGIASIKYKQGDIQGSQDAIKLANNELAKNQEQYGLAHNIEQNKAEDIANAKRSSEIGDVASGLEEFVKGEGQLGILNPIGQMISGVQRGGLTVAEGAKQFGEGLKQISEGKVAGNEDILGGALTVVNGVGESAFAGLPEAQQFNTLLGGAKDVISATLPKDTAEVLNKTLDMPFQFATTVGGMLGWNPEEKSNSKKFQQLLDTLISFPLMSEGHKLISGQPSTIQDIIQSSKDKKEAIKLSEQKDFIKQAYEKLSGANIGDIIKVAKEKGYNDLADELSKLTAGDLANHEIRKETNEKIDNLHSIINGAGFNTRTPEAQQALHNEYKSAIDKLHSIGKEELDNHLSDVEKEHNKSVLEDKIVNNEGELKKETNPFAKEALQKVVDGLKEELSAYQEQSDEQQGLNRIQNLRSEAKKLLPTTEPPKVESPDVPVEEVKPEPIVKDEKVGSGGGGDVPKVLQKRKPFEKENIADNKKQQKDKLEKEISELEQRISKNNYTAKQKVEKSLTMPKPFGEGEPKEKTIIKDGETYNYAGKTASKKNYIFEINRETTDAEKQINIDEQKQNDKNVLDYQKNKLSELNSGKLDKEIQGEIDRRHDDLSERHKDDIARKFYPNENNVSSIRDFIFDEVSGNTFDAKGTNTKYIEVNGKKVRFSDHESRSEQDASDPNKEKFRPQEYEPEDINVVLTKNSRSGDAIIDINGKTYNIADYQIDNIKDLGEFVYEKIKKELAVEQSLPTQEVKGKDEVVSPAAKVDEKPSIAEIKSDVIEKSKEAQKHAPIEEQIKKHIEDGNITEQQAGEFISKTENIDKDESVISTIEGEAGNATNPEQAQGILDTINNTLKGEETGGNADGVEPPKPPAEEKKTEDSEPQKPLAITKEALNKEFEKVTGKTLPHDEQHQEAVNTLSALAEHNGSTIKDEAQNFTDTKYNIVFDENGKQRIDPITKQPIRFNPTFVERIMVGINYLSLVKRLAELRARGEESSVEAEKLGKQLENNVKLQRHMYSESGRSLSAQNTIFNMSPEGDIELKYNQIARDYKFNFKMPTDKAEFDALTPEQQQAIKPIYDSFEKYKSDTKANYEKELANQNKIMQDEFDKKLNDELKKHQGKPKSNTPKRTKEVVKSELDKARAQFVRDSQSMMSSGGLQAIKSFSKVVKLAVEYGIKSAKEFYDAFKDDFKAFSEKEIIDAYNSEVKKGTREGALEDLEKYAKENNITNITKGLSDEGLVDDVVKSYLGEIPNKDILETALKDVQSILPDATLTEVRDSYIKQGEYKKLTEKQQKTIVQEADSELKKRAKLQAKIDEYEKKIKEIEKNGKLWDENKKEKTEIDTNLRKAQEHLKQAMDKQGLSKDTTSAFAKEKKAEVVKSHNDKVDKFGLPKELKINETDVEKIDDKIMKANKMLNDLLKKDPTNKDVANALFSLNKENTKADEAIKLNRSTEALKSSKAKAERDLAAGKFEDKKTDSDMKQVAEYNRANIAKKKAERIFEQAKKDYDEKHLPKWRKVLNSIPRGQTVRLISGIVGTARIGGATLLKPSADIASRQIGKLSPSAIFNKIAGIKMNTERETPNLKTELRTFKESLTGFNEKQAKAKIESTKSNLDGAIERISDVTDKLNNLKKGSKEYSDFVHSDEYNKAVNDFNTAKSEANKLLAYEFLGGDEMDTAEAMKAWKNRLDILKKGSTAFEESMGGYLRQGRKSTGAYDTFKYIADGFGRSHAALKDLSARQAFLEHWYKGVDKLTDGGKNELSPNDAEVLMVRAYEKSFLGGKFQGENGVAKWIRNTEHEWDKKGGGYIAASFLLKMITPVLRIPANIYKEGHFKYLLGSIFAPAKFAHEVYKYDKSLSPEQKEGLKGLDGFMDKLRGTAENMPPDVADHITELRNKGFAGAAVGLALGTYLSSTGQLGYDDKRHKILWNGEPLDKFTNGVLLHTPFFVPFIIATIFHQVKKDDTADDTYSAMDALNKTFKHVYEESAAKPLLELDPSKMWNQFTTVAFTKDIFEALDDKERKANFKEGFFKGIWDNLKITTGIGRWTAPEKEEPTVNEKGPESEIYKKTKEADKLLEEIINAPKIKYNNRIKEQLTKEANLRLTLKALKEGKLIDLKMAETRLEQIKKRHKEIFNK